MGSVPLSSELFRVRAMSFILMKLACPLHGSAKNSYAKLQDITASKIPTTERESNMERKVTKMQGCPGSPFV